MFKTRNSNDLEKKSNTKYHKINYNKICIEIWKILQNV